MQPLILLPTRNLWLPRQPGRVSLATLEDVPGRNRQARLPHYLQGDRVSGDTLAIFTPYSNQPPSSNYATLGVRNGHLVLEFDTTTQETAIFSGKMPRNYTASAGLTVYVSWMAATATSGTIGWDVTFERMANGGDDMDSDSFATAQTVTAATVSGTSGIITVTSVACTFGAAGTDSIAAGDDFRLRVRRDVANDTATGDAQLLSVEIKET